MSEEPPHRSDVELPISVQGSLLDFLFAQEEVQCCDNMLDNEPVNDYGGKAKPGSQLAVSYDNIREHKKTAELKSQN